MNGSRAGQLFLRGASPLGLAYSLSRSLLRHARSVREAHSLRSFADSRTVNARVPRDRL